MNDPTPRQLLIDALRRFADDLEAIDRAEREAYGARVRAALRQYEDADCSTPKRGCF